MKFLPFGVVLSFVLCGASLCTGAEEPLRVSIDPIVTPGNVLDNPGRMRTIHFHVVLSNASTADVRFWDETFSWGYYALTFKGTDGEGKAWAAKKIEVGFTRNFPRYFTIKPKDSLVIDVYFGDERIWEGFPMRLNHGTIQAICEVKPDEDSRANNVWTGRIVSEPKPIAYWVK